MLIEINQDRWQGCMGNGGMKASTTSRLISESTMREPEGIRQYGCKYFVRRLDEHFVFGTNGTANLRKRMTLQQMPVSVKPITSPIHCKSPVYPAKCLSLRQRDTDSTLTTICDDETSQPDLHEDFVVGTTGTANSRKEDDLAGAALKASVSR